MSPPGNEPLLLVSTKSIAHQNVEFVLQEETVKYLQEKVGDRPVSVLSIIGPQNTDKTVIFENIARYLKAVENDIVNWLDGEGNANGRMWDFEQGSPDESGIWCCNRPFFIKTGDDGKEVAIILLYSQLPKPVTWSQDKVTAALTTLTSALSCYTLFNVTNHIDEVCLASLGRSVGLALQKGGLSSPKIFQNAMFLIQDWNYPSEYCYGTSGGGALVANILQDSRDLSNDSRVARALIKSAFENVTGCLLPFPGFGALQKDFDGDIDKMDSNFTDILNEVIPDVVNIDEMIMKRDENGVAVNAMGEWRSLADKWIRRLNSAKNELSTKHALACIGKTSETYLEERERVDVAFQAYQDGMKFKTMKLGRDREETEIRDTHEEAREMALKAFSKGALEDSSDSEEDIEESGDDNLRKLLEEKMNSRYEKMTLDNRRKLAKSLESWCTNSIANYEQKMLRTFPRVGNTKAPLRSSLLQESQRSINSYIADFKKKLNDEAEVELFLKKLTTAQDNVLEILCCGDGEKEKDRESGVSSLTRHSSFASLDTAPCQSSDTRSWINENTPFHSMPARSEASSSQRQKYATQEEKVKAFRESVDEKKLTGQANSLVGELKKLYEAEIQKATTNSEMEACQNAILAKFDTECPLPNNTHNYRFLRETLDNALNLLRMAMNMSKMAMEKVKSEDLEKAVTESISRVRGYLSGRKFTCMDDLERVYKEAVAKEENVLETLFTVDEESDRLLECIQIFNTKAGQVLEDIRAEYVSSKETERAQLTKQISILCQKYKDNLNAWRKAGMTWEASKDLRSEASKTAHEELKRMLGNYGSTNETVQQCMIGLQDNLRKITEDCKARDDVQMVGLAESSKLVVAQARAWYEQEMRKCTTPNLFTPNLKSIHDSISRTTMERFETQDAIQYDQCLAALKTAFLKLSDENDRKRDGKPSIGIDLGTTYSCASVFKAGETIIIPNSVGYRTTPSYVMINGAEELVGEDAKSRAYENASGTLYDVKRILGKPFSDKNLQEDMKLWPFSVVDGGRGLALIQVEDKRFNPEMISGRVLGQLKKDAEAFLSEDNIETAVVTVPAYFSEGQRQATLHAAKLAGFKSVSLLKEPVAAAMAYQLQYSSKADNEPKHILIFDLGGGTFDVAILKVDKGNIEVVTVDGDTHLGGEDFDKNMMEYCAKEFKDKHKIDLLQGKDSPERSVRIASCRQLERLKADCERKKRSLTTARSATVKVNQIHEDIMLEVTITRGAFERINDKHFRRTIKIVQRALAGKNLSKDMIDDVVLVGGSTRIPKLQQLLKDFFPGKELTQNINPDEAVAYGAGLYAAIRKGDVSQLDESFTRIKDITPKSMGVEVYGGGYSVIIPKGTPIPVTLEEKYFTAHNNQTSVEIVVFEGENPVAVNNEKLGEFYLNGIPPGQAGQEDIHVEMRIDEDAIMHVTAKCTGQRKSLPVTVNKGRMSEQQVMRYLAQAQSA